MQMTEIQKSITHDEMYYRKSLEEAAEVVAQRHTAVVLVTGGSCAGKTTTTKILSDLIKQKGLVSHTISLDDFYRNPEDSVYFEDGTRDIESINSLETGLIRQCIDDLVNGREAKIPRYDFITGRRTDDYQRLTFGENDVAIIEGLHALNPVIYGDLPHYGVYLYTSSPQVEDPRFFRRLVRDNFYRGSDAALTFYLWENVKKHEPENIDRFAPCADMCINTFFPYERRVLSPYAAEILKALPATDPHIEQAREMLEKISTVGKIPFELVPKDSLLQEFVKL